MGVTVVCTLLFEFRLLRTITSPFTKDPVWPIFLVKGCQYVFKIQKTALCCESDQHKGVFYFIFTLLLHDIYYTVSTHQNHYLDNLHVCFLPVITNFLKTLFRFLSNLPFCLHFRLKTRTCLFGEKSWFINDVIFQQILFLSKIHSLTGIDDKQRKVRSYCSLHPCPTSDTW